MRLRLCFCLFVFPLMIGLTGCQATPFANRGAAKATPVAESPITGAAIAVTSLDAAPAERGTAQSPAPKAAPAATGTRPTATAPAAPEPEATTQPIADVPEPASPPSEAVAAEPVVPVAVKTAAHLACEKGGGRWSVAGGGTAAFCQSPTRDAGKSCRKSTDCTGYCLEKSRTCAPVTPMLGCHDILNEAGRMLTQCIN